MIKPTFPSRALPLPVTLAVVTPPPAPPALVPHVTSLNLRPLVPSRAGERPPSFPPPSTLSWSPRDGRGDVLR